MLIPIRNDHRYQASAAADRAQQRVSEFNIQNAPAYDRPDRMDDWSADYLAALAEIAWLLLKMFRMSAPMLSRSARISANSASYICLVQSR